MKLAIWTIPGDGHALAVEQVLCKRGHEVTRVVCGDLPRRSSISLALDNRFAGAFRFGSGPEVDLEVDVAWLRRLAPPSLGTSVDPRDLRIAANENEQFIGSAWRASSPGAVWVNSFAARVRANAKAVQLAEAQKVGLQIPETLISNDPVEIEALIRSSPGEVIYKMFTQDAWEREGAPYAHPRAQVLRAGDLPSPGALRLTPGIYQRRLDKDFEVRATFFGRHCKAVKIETPPDAEVDWRSAPSGQVRFSEMELPGEVRECCEELMRRLDLRFACFDLIANQAGWWFLELNQMGQFLWLEQRLPELQMLDAFVQFLEASAPTNFVPGDTGVRLADLYPPAVMRPLIEADQRAHEGALRRYHQY